MYRILVTGWRDWPQRHAHVIADTLNGVVSRNIPPGSAITVIDGACPSGGVDDYVHRWALAGLPGFMIIPERHPADWQLHGRRAGPIRNRHMVSLGAWCVAAFPGPGSRGTWDCLEQAVNAGIRPIVHAWGPWYDQNGTTPAS